MFLWAWVQQLRGFPWVVTMQTCRTQSHMLMQSSGGGGISAVMAVEVLASPGATALLHRFQIPDPRELQFSESECSYFAGWFDS